MAANSPLDFAKDNRDRFLRDLKELLSIPSISTLPPHRPDMHEAAEWLHERLTDVGFEAELIPGNGHPLVYGEWLNAPGAPTVLAYGHYDVQPVDPIDLWKSPPFEPTVRDGSIYARGASDDKGQTMTVLNAAESFFRTRKSLPINLKVLIEGQEESGGEVVERYVRDHPERLKADVAQISDGGMFAPGIPTIDTGLRGNVYTEVFAYGAAHDLHSGLYGGVAPNPLQALAYVIANLKDLNGRISIPGFYDDVHMPPAEILDSWRSLPFDEDTFRQEIGASELVGEDGFSPLERIWARPTLDVHGIKGGFTGEGGKTVIPAEASAKISMRVVPDQRADRIFELFRQRVLELAPSGVRLDVKLISGGDPVVVADKSEFILAVRQALAETFDRPPVLARSGGSIPIVGLFKRLLGIDTVLMGWGLPDDNLHAPNEKMSLANFQNGTDAVIRFWELLGSK
jgi:acetylornithine deacetylase/succinyl-diaminopimelate desuccinylase-like protein